MHKTSELPLLALIEAGGVNDLPVVMPAAEATSDVVIEAIKTLRAAGYRVVKLKKPKVFKRGKDRVGPTFVAEFSDGAITRMSTFTSLTRDDIIAETMRSPKQVEIRAKARGLKVQQEIQDLVVSRRSGVSLVRCENARSGARAERDHAVLFRGTRNLLERRRKPWLIPNMITIATLPTITTSGQSPLRQREARSPPWRHSRRRSIAST